MSEISGAFKARFQHFDGYKSPARQADLERVFRAGAAWQAGQDATLIAELEKSGWATEVHSCEVSHEEPYDFDQCATHDRTLPRGGDCDHAGMSAMDYETSQHMKQRGRAVRAEMRAEAAEARLDKIRARHLRAGTKAQSVCVHCDVAWPCETIKILDGEADD